MKLKIKPIRNDEGIGFDELVIGTFGDEPQIITEKEEEKIDRQFGKVAMPKKRKKKSKNKK